MRLGGGDYTETNELYKHLLIRIMHFLRLSMHYDLLALKGSGRVTISTGIGVQMGIIEEYLQTALCRKRQQDDDPDMMPV